MRLGILSIAAAATLTLTSSLACGLGSNDGIVPENDMWIGPNVKMNKDMSQSTFDEVLDRVEDIYSPVLSGMGKRLNIERNWNDGTVNAYASQSGNTWKIAMFGGLARHETVTADGFALVACHELGHHLGGAPKKKSWWSTSWASNEGQSDYFGAMKCLRKYMELDDNVALMADVDVPALAVEKCEANFANAEDVAMCKRGAMAGMSLAGLFGALSNLSEPLDFATPDDNVVSSTNHNHPAAQCRLDTYFAGAICDKYHYDDIDEDDINSAQCARVDGYDLEARPLCWYKP